MTYKRASEDETDAKEPFSIDSCKVLNRQLQGSKLACVRVKTLQSVMKRR